MSPLMPCRDPEPKSARSTGDSRTGATMATVRRLPTAAIGLPAVPVRPDRHPRKGGAGTVPIAKAATILDEGIAPTVATVPTAIPNCGQNTSKAAKGAKAAISATRRPIRIRRLPSSPR
jgi:hypothetical protein